MGKITNALKKAAEERLQRLDKITQIKKRDQIIVEKMDASEVDARIISYFDSKAVIAEQYKILRTNILSQNNGKRAKTMVITSAQHSEGKTVTSLNLAITMAQAAHKPKILLIDADMRRGQLYRYLGVPRRQGLSELLTGEAQLSDVMFTIDVDNVTFIGSGEFPDNPVELLSSDKMKDLLEEVRERFDYILIDTPPVISVTDPGILGAQVDGVLMVIQAGRTQRGIVQRATELLHQAHAKVMGHLLTNIEYHLPEYIYRYL